MLAGIVLNAFIFMATSLAPKIVNVGVVWLFVQFGIVTLIGVALVNYYLPEMKAIEPEASEESFN